GFGTLDELTEILTLAQTRKLDRKISVLLYGTSYWKEIINFDALVRHGMVSPEDLALIHFVDEPAAALRILQSELAVDAQVKTPAFAKSATPGRPVG
ncbi:MAG TPA: LOG family protein, partial [Polyangiales bacterium]